MTEVENYVEISGDLIKLAKEGEKFDAIVHGCNCFTRMGAGIAVAVKNEFPDAYRADQETVTGDKSKLGTYTFGVHWMPGRERYLHVINAYTQYTYANNLVKKPVDYDAIAKVFKQINKDYKWQHIGMPMIGCGLAGGDWDIVKGLIKEHLTDVQVTVVFYDK